MGANGFSCKIICPNCSCPSSVSSYLTNTGLRFNLFNFTRHYKLHGSGNSVVSNNAAIGILDELRLLKEDVMSVKTKINPPLNEAVDPSIARDLHVQIHNLNLTLDGLNDRIKKGTTLFLIIFHCCL